MKKVMPEVGEEIWSKYSAIGVADETPVFLFLDNAGGHGTNNFVDEYVMDLWRRRKLTAPLV